jgi:cysteine desulfurase / selenocysteine lyase
MFDVAAARAETPGCDASVFLLSAGSSLPTSRTLDAVIGHLRREAEIGGYGAAEEAEPVLERGRVALAALLGGRSDEVAYVPSDSVAFTKAWWGWVLGGNLRAGQTVLIDRLAYHSHYAAIVQTRAVVDFEIGVLPSTEHGTVDIDRVELDSRVGAVCATLIGTHSGNVNPISELGAITADRDVPLFVDGCQALGQMVVDVAALGCHVFTATGRKYLRGPRGSGVLWVAGDVIDRFSPPGLDGLSTAWTSDGLRIRPGIGRFVEYETSYASLVGLAHAAEQAVETGVPAIEDRVTALGEHLRAGLAAVPGVAVHDTAPRRCAIVTFTIEGIPAIDVVRAATRLDIRVNASTASWSSLDMEAKGLDSVVRASPHYFNTTDEVDQLLDLVQTMRR